MFKEKRPTCVSVIGWVWIILGGLMILSAALALFTWTMIGTHAKADPEFQLNMPAMMKYFPYIAVIQLFVALTGFISGISFLKLKSWSRVALEILSWLILLFVIGFGGYAVSQFFSETKSFVFGIFEMIFMIAIFGMYIVPLAIILKYLKGNPESPSGSVYQQLAPKSRTSLSSYSGRERTVGL